MLVGMVFCVRQADAVLTSAQKICPVTSVGTEEDIRVVNISSSRSQRFSQASVHPVFEGT